LQTTLQALSSSETFAVVLANVPRKLEQVIERIPVTALINLGAKIENIEGCLAIEITKTANMISVTGNLKQGQALTIAKELIAEYPNESLEDFCYCLRSGIKGRYNEAGKIFRFDIVIIFEWFKAYLEEKYKAIEDKLMKEREQNRKAIMLPTEFTVTNEKALSWIEQWKQSIANIEVKQILPMTEKEIREEGRERPKKEAYKNSITREKFELNQKIHQAASEFYKDLLSFGTLQIFLVGEFEIFAESQQHAEEIYKIATTPNEPNI
jgi:hypothetical protein